MSTSPRIPAADSEADPLIGKIVAGKYDVIQRIARGGMSRVYVAIQHPLNRRVALKVLHDPRIASGMRIRDRFLFEASVYAKLRHPNTVTVYDYGVLEETGSLYMVMELVEGRNLAQELRGGPLTAERAARVGFEVCRSLQEAHELGIVHRDLKPANIMIAPTMEGEAVKVLDFGVAAEVDDTEDAERLGTPRYMAPEQILHGTIDPRADLYSLGIVLFEMLVGHPPFQAETRSETMMAHVNRAAPLVTEYARQDIPEALVRLVAQLLEKSPDERPPSAAVVRRRLYAILVELRGDYGELLSSPTGSAPATPLPAGLVAQAPQSGGTSWVLLFATLAIFAVGAGVLVAGGVLLADWSASASTPASAPTFTLRSAPAGAEVFESGVLLGRTPIVIPLAGGGERSFEVRLQGYEPAVVARAPSPVPVELDVALLPLETTARPTP